MGDNAGIVQASEVMDRMQAVMVAGVVVVVPPLLWLVRSPDGGSGGTNR